LTSFVIVVLAGPSLLEFMKLHNRSISKKSLLT
jgi:hypothetical protein